MSLVQEGSKGAGMSESTPSKETPAATSGECPVCYETFQPPKVSRRMLSCGHTFCHDCLVKCLLSQDEDHLQNTLTCPICRFVTFLCRKKDCWPPSKPALSSPSLELPLSPSSLSCGGPLGSANTLVVPGHFFLPLHSYNCPQGRLGCPTVDSLVPPPPGLQRESHVLIISQWGTPLLEENCAALAQDHNPVAGPEPADSQPSLGISCFQSPIMMAVFLVSAVALLGAVLPWLVLVRNRE